MEPEDSSLCSHDLAYGKVPEPDESLYPCPPKFCKINFKINPDSVDIINYYGLEDLGFDS